MISKPDSAYEYTPLSLDSMKEGKWADVINNPWVTGFPFLPGIDCTQQEHTSWLEKGILEEAPPAGNEFLEKFVALCRDGRVAFVVEHTLGFALPGFQAGDTMWALDCARTPYILRQVGNYYKLVGDCYLHGALNPIYTASGYRIRNWPRSTEIIEIW